MRWMLAALVALFLPRAASAETRRVALVIGVGQYAKLDPGLAVPDAADQALALARVLETEAGFDQVLPMVDAVAHRSAIERMLLGTLPGQIDGDDLLLVYFAGHGLGADFGEPYLLPYDVDPVEVQRSALSIERLALGLREAIPAASLVLITDAVHDQRLGDLVLMGPNARSWPALPGEVLCLSATGPTELPVATPFGRLVTDGLAGAADASGDGAVTSGELVRFVQVQMSAAVGAVAHPVESGAAAPDMVLARVRRGPADFPDYQPERTRVRQRRAAGAAVAGLGAALGFAGLGFYLDALKVYPYVQDDPRERLDPEPGQTYQGLRDRYQRDWLLVPITFAASGTLLASGGALLVWPAPGGVGVGVQARF